MFREHCGEKKYNLWEGCSTHPHNTYIQLNETGLIGFGFVMCLFIFISCIIIKHIYFKYIVLTFDFQLCLISAILISIWPLPQLEVFNN